MFIRPRGRPGRSSQPTTGPWTSVRLPRPMVVAWTKGRWTTSSLILDRPRVVHAPMVADRRVGEGVVDRLKPGDLRRGLRRLAPPHPDEAVRLARRVACRLEGLRHFGRPPVGRDEGAAARWIEGQPVEGALDRLLLQPPDRERRPTVGASVAQADGITGRRPPEDQPLPEARHAHRPPTRHLVGFEHGIPLVGDHDASRGSISRAGPQQMRGSISPASMSTRRVPPMAVRINTRPGGSASTVPIRAAPSP